MMQVKLVTVVTTVATQAQAQSMARTIVERKLAACAQINEIESFYVWDGEVQNEKEFRVQFKTTDVRYQELEAEIRKLHAYKIPELHASPIEQSYPPYAKWVEENSKGN